VEELLGRDVGLLTRTAPTAGLAAPVAIARGGRWQREQVQRRKDGSQLVVRLLSEVACDTRGQPLGFVTVCVDLGAPASVPSVILEVGEEMRRPE
jgi:hypothetical protein